MSLLTTSCKTLESNNYMYTYKSLISVTKVTSLSLYKEAIHQYPSTEIDVLNRVVEVSAALSASIGVVDRTNPTNLPPL